MNRLGNASSAYLRLHADNPVHWQPWGDAALSEARQRNVPVFLSIGYMACHWCHVMERESFRDEAVASFLNEQFVCIKVDREERPDVDAAYMDALVELTGEGGWPLSIFLLPDGRPFYGGTYFPPYTRYGIPSFRDVLRGLVDRWQQATELAEDDARRLMERMSPTSESASGGFAEATLREIVDSYNRGCGGWGYGPRFVQPPRLRLLLESGEEGVDTARHLLEVADGSGVHDQLGGGFHRYAVDEDWVVPHFEKMLYDNAQIAVCALRAWENLGEPRLLTLASRTLRFIVDDLSVAGGGFAASLAADDPGGEGAYYTWTPGEVAGALGADTAVRFGQVFGVTSWGNHEGGRSVLHRVDDGGLSLLSAARRRLLAVRSQRPAPERDDKRVVVWNALAISALCHAADRLGELDLLDHAVSAGTAILELCAGGELRRCEGGPSAMLEDHGAWVLACLDLHRSTGRTHWLDAAARSGRSIVDSFVDGDSLLRSLDTAIAVSRPPVLEGAEPSPAGLALEALFALAALGCAGIDEARVDVLLVAAIRAAASLPMGAAPSLARLALSRRQPPAVLAICGDDGSLRKTAARHALRSTLVVLGPHKGFAIFDGKETTVPAAWLCRGASCSLPVSEPSSLRQLLGV